ncbi:bifunctional phosphatase PAP2/diacylglycerol kinase family protein [Arthrobacter sp. 35W]|uniref:bifunctional phosphatase PAP2/diacylglycerol kinase family protein n=1 Tax=Arthrobacter sp. 35W TaxID=1132441 RepID=UPI00040C9891|nr:bifunctional phosphatase PAP2/diacylglycerol kinase family protein [Arthrobacter sp. 35W]
MNLLHRPLSGPGTLKGRITQVDRAVVAKVVALPPGPWDGGLRWLTNAATKGKLWFAASAAMAVVPGTPRRAAAHGLMALGVASAVTNLVFKTALPRLRPHPGLWPAFRFNHPQPTSSSLPSGHSASAAAFATGVAFSSPALGLAVAPVAAAVAYSRVHTGAHWPSDVALGSAVGVGAAFLTRGWFPAAGPVPPPSSTAAEAPALGSGEGLVVAMNTMGGSFSPEAVQSVKEAFPEADVVEIGPGEDVAQALADAAGRGTTTALGVWGGDGTVGAAAQAAVDAGLPLLVFPGGTLNHFARDIGVDSVESAVNAAARGQAVVSDLGTVDLERGDAGNPEHQSRPMLNTASVGVYPDLVRRRERLQGELGKPLAALIAGLRTFASAQPVLVKIDGVPHKLWTLYIGRGRYYPHDLAPLLRPVMDDGLLDIRMVSADRRLARTRLLFSVFTGTTATSPVTTLRTARTISVESDGAPLSLAIDGEALAGVHAAHFAVEAAALRIYAPAAP